MVPVQQQNQQNLSSQFLMTEYIAVTTDPVVANILLVPALPGPPPYLA
jgi:hypothetical protein